MTFVIMQKTPYKWKGLECFLTSVITVCLGDRSRAKLLSGSSHRKLQQLCTMCAALRPTRSFDPSSHHAGCCIVRMCAILFVLWSWNNGLIVSSTPGLSYPVQRFRKSRLGLCSSLLLGTNDHLRQTIFINSYRC